MSWITHNWGVKLLSLAVAVLLWMATVGEPDAATAVGVPIQYRNLPQNLEFSSELVQSAYIEVRGSSGRLTGLSNAVVMLDMAGQTRPGERTFSILEENVKLPPGVQFVRAVPSQIRVKLEYQVSRSVPVVVRYAAVAPEGYRIAKQDVSPQLAKIMGPASRVQAIDRVQTDPIEVASIDVEQTFHVQAFAGDQQVRVDRNDQMITVKVTLEKNK